MPVFVVDGVLHLYAAIPTRDDASPPSERSHTCLPAAKQDIFARMRFQHRWSGCGVRSVVMVPWFEFGQEGQHGSVTPSPTPLYASLLAA